MSVNPKSLAERRDDWVKVVKVWDRIVAFVTDPANKAEAVKIMGGRAGVPPEEYAKFMPGHALPDARRRRWRASTRRTGLDSLYGSRQGRRRVQRREQGLRQAAAGRRIPRRLAVARSAGRRPSRRSVRMAAVTGATGCGSSASCRRGGGSRWARWRSCCRSGSGALVSYVPFIWHPMVRVTDPGDVDWMTRDQLVEGDAFRTRECTRSPRAAGASRAGAAPTRCSCPRRTRCCARW